MTAAFVVGLLTVATQAEAVIPGSTAASSPSSGTTVSVTVTDVGASSLCASTDATLAVPTGTVQTLTLGNTFLAGRWGQIQTPNGLAPEQPVQITTGPLHGYDVEVRRNDCWTVTPVAGDALFTLMVDFGDGTGEHAEYVSLSMDRVAHTSVSVTYADPNNGMGPLPHPLCIGQVIGLTATLGIKQQDYTGPLSRAIDLRVQFRRTGTTSWRLLKAVSTQPWGVFSSNFTVSHGGYWRVVVPSTIVDPIRYTKAVSQVRRLRVHQCT